MLRINDLSLSYDDMKVFSNVSFNVCKGEVVCLYGESGCGKSSLIRAVLGFEDSSGKIEVDGKALSESTINDIRRITAYIPQDLSLPYDTVEQAVMTLFELRTNRGIKFSKEQLMNDWEVLGLDHSLYGKRITEISGGQRQRIMLSVAGLTGKKLLLADEPTSALDPSSASLVANYFHILSKKRGMAILTVSHSERFASECDRKIKIGQ